MYEIDLIRLYEDMHLLDILLDDWLSTQIRHKEPRVTYISRAIIVHTKADYF